MGGKSDWVRRSVKKAMAGLGAVCEGVQALSLRQDCKRGVKVDAVAAARSPCLATPASARPDMTQKPCAQAWRAPAAAQIRHRTTCGFNVKRPASPTHPPNRRTPFEHRHHVLHYRTLCLSRCPPLPRRSCNPPMGQRCRRGRERGWQGGSQDRSEARP